jgi:prepilin-type N-terminal cleavage/methylation domain-containing protein
VSSRTRRQRGFTLIEVLAVVLLTGIVLTVAIDFYLDLSRASRAAVEGTRGVRRAALVLDRVARDLEAAVLVHKPAEVDPLEHPWLFLAESDANDAGAHRLKFVTRGRRPRTDTLPESDLELVAWVLEPAASGDFELRRWSAPQLPEGLDRSFPPFDETRLVAEGVAEFGVRLLGDDGAWVGRWDSSLLVDSAELPVAAEVVIALRDDPEAEAVDGPYVRRVLIPLRPLDLEAQLEGDALAGGPDGGVDADGDGIPDDEEDGQDPGCVTVQQCLASHPEIQAQLAEDPEAQSVVQGSLNQCASLFAAVFPVPPDCLQ